MSSARGDVIRVRRIIKQINSAEGRQLSLTTRHGRDDCTVWDDAVEDWVDADGDDPGILVDGTLADVEAYLAAHWPHCMPEQRRDWSQILSQAAQIVRSYDTGVTLRQLFYQLVARQIIDNTRQQYTYLSKKTAEGRRDGTFPELIDKTSKVLLPQWFYSPEDAVEDLRDSYRRDRTEGQEVSIYLAVEKAAIEISVAAMHQRGQKAQAVRVSKALAAVDSVPMTARQTPGKAMVTRVIADMANRGFEPDAKERELLALAQGLADQLDGLRKSVATDGYSTTLKTGRIVANPAVALINTTSLALAKVLAQVQMSDQPPINLVKQRAGNARWRAHNQAKQQWDQLGR